MSNFYIMRSSTSILTNKKMLVFGLCILIVILCIRPSFSYASKIIELHVNGAIGPATADYIVRNVDKAKNVDLILVTLDTSDLLSQLRGVTVTQHDQKIILNTSKPEIQTIYPDWRTRFLSIITVPTIAYLLLLLGIYGIFFELVNPGHLLPGVVGCISMFIALYALQLLPTNYAGFFLIVLGVGFIAAEAFIPSYGSLGGGGTIAFVIGSIMLIDTDNQMYQISWSVIWAMATVNILVFIIVLGMVLQARRQKIQNGLLVLLGAKGRALGDINLSGQVMIHGEIWSAHSQHVIAADKPIKVIGATGLVLEIEEELNQGE